MIQAEQKCERPPIAWSPTFRLHFKLVQFWSLRYSLAKHPRASWDILFQLQTDITKLLTEVNVDDPRSPVYVIDPPLNWKANLTRAKRLLRQITINAQKHRSEFLAQRQLEALQTPSSKDAEVLKRIIKAEEK